jgi:hypothetical protein
MIVPPRSSHSFRLFVIRNDIVIICELFTANRTDAVLFDDFPVHRFPHLRGRSQFPNLAQSGTETFPHDCCLNRLPNRTEDSDRAMTPCPPGTSRPLRMLAESRSPRLSLALHGKHRSRSRSNEQARHEAGGQRRYHRLRKVERGKLSRKVEPILQPVGFGEWKRVNPSLA